MMKSLLIILALLAGAKVAHQEYLFRTSTRDVIVSAYKERAVKACQSDAVGTMLGLSQAWTTPNSISLSIGKRSIDVHWWDFEHTMWSARFRNPYLLLSASHRSMAATCEYDIVNARAIVFR